MTIDRRARPSDLIAIYVCSGTLIVAAVLLGHAYLIRSPAAGAGGTSVIDGMLRWDGRSYLSILERGYPLGAGGGRRIAFFPGYPLLARATRALSGLSAPAALLVVSWTCLAGVLWLVGRYPARSDDARGGNPADGRWAAVAVAFLPAGFFLRMAYTESLCLLLLVSTLYVMRRGGPAVLAAALAGAASGTRSVGIAAALPVLIYAIRVDDRWWRNVRRAALMAALSTWGVASFAVFQWVRYQQPLAFVHIQDSYRMRPSIDGGPRAWKLATLEPIWAAYRPTSDAFWGRLPMSGDNPEAVFNLQFWNPICFVTAVGLVVFGGAKRWLDRYELTLAAGLLSIPYLTRGYDFGMCSQARFTVVCFPIYIVLGRLLATLPEAWRISLVVLMAGQMCAWAALFAAGYPIF